MANGQKERGGAVRPTLFLGLGGTGKEVLLRLRRKFYERFGTTGLPCTKFLWVDTDTKDRMAQGEPMDEIFRAVAFEPYERLALLDGMVGSHMASIFRNPGQWEHVHEWLYEEVKRYGTEIADGAGGVRAVGRLAFFFHYGGREGLLNRLNGILGPQELRSHEVINRTEAVFRELGYEVGKDIEFDPDPQVFLICSVAGGTGAGTFLDTAFLLKHLALANRTYGALFLPNVFYPSSIGEVAQRSHANGYASLKELEFYTLRQETTTDIPNSEERDGEGLNIDYDVEWEKDQKLTSIPGPPCSVTYLLESNNEGGIGLKTRTELFQMAAESLFLDFMPGAFSSAKRSHYSNVAQNLSGQRGVSVKSKDVTISQHFARRYASFGMSKLEIPVDLLKRACAAQLGHDIVRNVWGRDPAATNIRSAVLEDMAQGDLTLTPDGLANRFGKSWRNQIHDGIEQVFRESALETAADVNALLARLHDFDRTTLRVEGSDTTRWGTAVSEIKSQTTPVVRQVENDLLGWLQRSCDEPSRGPRGLAQENGYLPNLISNLKAYYEFDGDHKPVFVRKKEECERDAELWNRAAERTRQELNRALGGWALIGLGQRGWTIDLLRDRWKDSVEQAAFAKASVVLYEQTMEVARKAVAFLESKRRPLEDFIEALDAMTSRFRVRRDDFRDIRDSVLSTRIYDDDKDWPSFYRFNVDPTGDPLEVDPTAQARQFLSSKSVSAKGGLWDLVENLELQGVQSLENDLMAFCERQFIHDFEVNPRQVDVLDHQSLKSRLDEIVNKMVRCALPMVRLESKLGSSTVRTERFVYLGIGKTTGPVSQAFLGKLQPLLQAKGYPLTAVLTTGRPSEVYLYLVSYAFPLSAMTTVKEDLHPAYYGFYRSLREGKIGEQKLQIPLHLSRRWEGRYNDLVVLSDREAMDTQMALESLLFGSALGVLDLKELEGTIDFGYRAWIPPASQRRRLGNRRETVEGLRANESLRRSILSEISKREDSLTNETRLRYYWLLSYLSVAQVVSRRAPERTLLENKLSKLQAQLAKTVPPETLDLDQIETAEEQAAEALDRADPGRLLKIADFYVLKELDPWVMGKSV